MVNRTMELRKKNTTLQGSIGLHAAMFYYSANGYACHTSSADASEIDLIIEKEGLIERVQVKTATMLKGKDHSFVVDLKGTHGHIDSKLYKKMIQDVQFDFLFVLTGSFDCYIFSKEEVGTRNSLALPSKVHPESWVGRIWQSAVPLPEEVLRSSKEKLKRIARERPNRPGKASLDMTKEELEALLVAHAYNFEAVGKHLKVSGNGVKKRAKKLGLPYHSRRYRKENGINIYGKEVDREESHS